MTQIKILIINHNGEEFLPSCFAALDDQTYKDFSITLVDNGSIDDSIKLTKKIEQDIEIIALDKNIGFCGAVNKGVLSTIEPYFAVLTPDCAPSPTWLETLVEEIEKGGNLFAVGAVQVFQTNKKKAKCAGIAYTLGGRAYNLSYRKDIKKISNEAVFAVQIIGSIFDKKTFAKASGLDEDFWKLYEDVDYAYRARLLGKTCITAKTAIFHRLSHANDLTKEDRFRLMARNMSWLRQKDMSYFDRFFSAIPRLIVENSQKKLANMSKCKIFYKKGLQESKKYDIINKSRIKSTFGCARKVFFGLIVATWKMRFTIHKEEI